MHGPGMGVLGKEGGPDIVGQLQASFRGQFPRQRKLIRPGNDPTLPFVPVGGHPEMFGIVRPAGEVLRPTRHQVPRPVMAVPFEVPAMLRGVRLIRAFQVPRKPHGSTPRTALGNVGGRHMKDGHSEITPTREVATRTSLTALQIPRLQLP